MKYIDSIKRAGRSLKSAKGRTILTSLAIAVGSFTLTLSLAAGDGARQYADKIVTSNVDPMSLFIAKDPKLSSAGAVGGPGLEEYKDGATAFGGTTFKTLSIDDVDKVKQNSNIAEVNPSYIVDAEYFTFQGVDTKYTSDITAYDASVKSEVAAGKLPTVGTQIPDDGVVVPESFVSSIKGKPSPESLIGKQLTLSVSKPANNISKDEIQEILATEGPKALETKLQPVKKEIKLKISAISAKSSTSFTASNALFISQKKAGELSNFLTKGTDQFQRYITVTAKVKDGADPAAVKTELEKQGITVQTAKDLQGLLFSIVNVLQYIVIGFGVIALIASVFGIINTQYISVLERTREIGLMKALGMRGSHVSRLFQLEAAWIGVLGGVLGAGIAILVGSLLNPWITEKLSLGDGIYLLIFQAVPIAILIVALMLIAMAAGWLPARKAAKLDPIEALRTE